MAKTTDSNNSFPADVEEGMIDHMNTDHVDALRHYCRYADIDMGENVPIMVGIDQNGFNIEANDRNIRFNFKQKCNSPNEVRKALVELVETARKKQEPANN